MFSSFAVPSSPPTRVAVSALSSTSIVISWDLPPPEGRNGDIIGYIINVTNLDSGVIQQITAAAVTNITIPNLRPFTIYVATVSARTAVGMGPFSNVRSVQTLEDGRCIRSFLLSYNTCVLVSSYSSWKPSTEFHWLCTQLHPPLLGLGSTFCSRHKWRHQGVQD